MKILFDTREKLPWTFEGCTCTVERRKLTTGDYALADYESCIVIERKSAADLIRSVTHGRKRFLRMMERLAEVAWSAVVVEMEWSLLLPYCERTTNVSPASLDGTMTALMLRYPKTHWVFRPTRETAERAAYLAMRRYWLDQSVKGTAA